MIHVNNTITSKTAILLSLILLSNPIFVALLYDGETGNTTLIINGTLALEAEEADKLYGAIRNETGLADTSFRIGSAGSLNTGILVLLMNSDL